MTKNDCTFCPTGNRNASYKDGRDATAPPYACGNHFMRLNDPRTFDPVSPAMAKMLREMLTDPDEAEFPDDDGE